MPLRFIRMGIMWRRCHCIEDLIKCEDAAGTAGGRGGGVGFMSLSSRGKVVVGWRRRYCGLLCSQGEGGENEIRPDCPFEG